MPVSEVASSNDRYAVVLLYSTEGSGRSRNVTVAAIIIHTISRCVEFSSVCHANLVAH